MACEYCEIIQREKKAAKLYEDDLVVAFLSPQPATIGHIIVVPKAHAPIFEAVPDPTLTHLFDIVNKLSIALFEAIKCEGTNVIVQNGLDAGQEVPHFSVHILARKAGDGLMFDWAPKQLSEQEMATVELQLKEELEKKVIEAEVQKEETGTGAKGEEAETGGEQKEGAEGEKKESGTEENYLIKQLRRMP